MTAFVAWLWQGLALALAAVIALRACRRLDAATRHVIWWGVLAAVLALPWLPHAASGAPNPALGADAPGAPALAFPAPPDWALAIGVGAWLGTVLLGSLRLARSIAFVSRLKRESHALPLARQDRLPLWTAERGSGRTVSLLVSEHVRTACAVGLGHGAVVLPRALVGALDDEALDQIVMHEHAHLQRRDDAWRLLQAIVECLAGFHPAVQIATRHIDLEREAACDDRVVLRTGEARRYASCLAEAAALASLARSRYEPSLLPGAVRGSSALRARVGRLLDTTRRRGARVAPATTVAGALVLCGAIATASQIDPLVTFDAERAMDRALAATHIVFPLPSAPDVRPSPLAAGARRAPVAVRPRDTAAPPVSASAAESSPPVEPLPVQDPTVDDAPALLTSRALLTASAVPASPEGTTVRPAAEATGVTPWAAAADAGTAVAQTARKGGVAVGMGTKKAGISVAGFFTRAGKAVGRSF